MDNTINILHGSYQDIAKLHSQHNLNINDIIIADDYPMIAAQGQIIEGSSTPVWNGRAKTLKDAPSLLYDLITNRLKKSLYFGAEMYPKFDININQTFGDTPKGYKDWKIDKGGYKLYTYKMDYESDLTTFNTYEPGAYEKPSVQLPMNAGVERLLSQGYECVVFSFPVLVGVSFNISQCFESDWLCSTGKHEYMCPMDFRYNYKYIDAKYTQYFTDNTSGTGILHDTITCKKSGTVYVYYIIGANDSNNNPYIKITFKE